jgi:hypothetical protein
MCVLAKRTRLTDTESDERTSGETFKHREGNLLLSSQSNAMVAVIDLMLQGACARTFTASTSAVRLRQLICVCAMRKGSYLV